MRQRTIAKSVELVGVGLHKGVPVRMVLEPLGDDSGIVFYRSDVGATIPLKVDNVVDTTMATVIGRDGVGVSTIEHLLSALYAYGIDNLRIILDNQEVPIMDGSSIGFCMLIEEAGIEELDSPKRAIVVKDVIEVRDNDKFVRLEPAGDIVFDFRIFFPHFSIRDQSYKFKFTTQKYKDEISRARTFGFLEEVNKLRSMGLARGGGLHNCIVLNESGVMNEGGLRYENEFVRHKILDAMGDMSLFGMPLVGSYISFAGSHKLNHLLTKKLLSNSSCYEVVHMLDNTYQGGHAFCRATSGLRLDTR